MYTHVRACRAALLLLRQISREKQFLYMYIFTCIHVCTSYIYEFIYIYTYVCVCEAALLLRRLIPQQLLYMCMCKFMHADA